MTGDAKAYFAQLVNTRSTCIHVVIAAYGGVQRVTLECRRWVQPHSLHVVWYGMVHVPDLAVDFSRERVSSSEPPVREERKLYWQHENLR